MSQPLHDSMACIAMIATLGAASAARAEDLYAPWLTQIGISDTIESAASWGKGQLIITVDTGIQANNAEFAPGQISAASSGCAATSFTCSNGANDDDGHGTAVASIAAGNKTLATVINYGGYNTPAGAYIGVAPNANLGAQKALDSTGTGQFSDVVNGIYSAADANASVINLSLTWLGSPSIVAAINYAASKGTYIVWAGGNSSAPLQYNANTSGLTSTAIAHLVFAGSVSSGNTLSWFSNTPGNGSLVTTSGSRTAFSARWIMAPGENIIAPYAPYGGDWYAAWTGTSMATPMVSGSLALLMSAWPILKTNGTAANLLLATATNLGNSTTYGTGLVNLTTAFQPYGTLSLTEANGQTLPVSGLTGTLITSGALGNLTSITSELSHFVALDSYGRNFTVNLSGLIRASPTAATVNPLPTNSNTGPNKMSYADGSELDWQITENPPPAFAGAGFSDSLHSTSHSMFAMLTEADRSMLALGYGNVLPSSYAYARALYDSEDAGIAASNLNTDLASLTEGGGQIAYGFRIGRHTRFAVSFSDTATQAAQPGVIEVTPAKADTWMTPTASSLSTGITQDLSDQLQVGLTLRTLREHNSLLGAAYDPSGPLSLGTTNVTDEVGVSALYGLTAHSSLYLEVSQAHTLNSGTTGGLIAGVSGLTARAWGTSFVSTDLFRDNDHLSLSVKQPLRVTAGSAQLATTAIDPVTGVASFSTLNVPLAPTGRETDWIVSYDTPLFKTQQLSLKAGYLKDYQNIQGNDTSTFGVVWSWKF